MFSLDRVLEKVVLASFVGDLSQIETLSEIKPPLIQSIIEQKPHKNYDGFELTKWFSLNDNYQ